MHGIMQTSVPVPLDFAATADRRDPVPYWCSIPHEHQYAL